MGMIKFSLSPLSASKRIITACVLFFLLSLCATLFVDRIEINRARKVYLLASQQSYDLYYENDANLKYVKWPKKTVYCVETEDIDEKNNKIIRDYIENLIRLYEYKSITVKFSGCSKEKLDIMSYYRLDKINNFYFRNIYEDFSNSSGMNLPYNKNSEIIKPMSAPKNILCTVLFYKNKIEENSELKKIQVLNINIFFNEKLLRTCLREEIVQALFFIGDHQIFNDKNYSLGYRLNTKKKGKSIHLTYQDVYLLEYITNLWAGEYHKPTKMDKKIGFFSKPLGLNPFRPFIVLSKMLQLNSILCRGITACEDHRS